MTDPIDKLEAELIAMRPRPIPPKLAAQIARNLNSAEPSSPWADRCLVGAMCSGVLAIGVIISVLLIASAGIAAPTPYTAGPTAAAPGPLVFARADPGWLDLQK